MTQQADSVSEISNLWATLLKVAPVLHPQPELRSLLKRPASTLSTTLDVCREIFTEESLEINSKWVTLAKENLNGICSFCYEHLEIADYNNDENDCCLVPQYELDFSNRSIVLHRLKVCIA